MLKPIVFANSAAAIMAIWVIVCALLSYIAPDLLFTVAQSWMHSISLEAVKTVFIPNFGSIILGVVSAASLTWITVYFTITLYNRLAK
ncbi:MAG: DUF5676 family membrane protein [Patescibacteria group bacterium]|nr:DUF5676 family membrane protein [Patescibacteria group bacterium]